MQTGIQLLTEAFLISRHRTYQTHRIQTALSTINGKSYIISHYEYESVNNAGKEISGLPASMTLTQVDRDDKTGKLTVNHAKKIDFSNVNGLWTPCNGSTTDWGTHLGSEEYEPDARAFEDPSSSSYKDVTNFAKLYFGDTSKANPYYYGWIQKFQWMKAAMRPSQHII